MGGALKEPWREESGECFERGYVMRLATSGKTMMSIASVIFSIAMAAVSLDSFADRYVVDPSAMLRQQPDIHANYQKNYLPLFGLKNIGPTEIRGEFERFEYIEFPLGNPTRFSGWMESKYLADEPASPGLLEKELAKTDRNNRRELQRIGLVALNHARHGHGEAYAQLAQKIANEYRNADNDFAIATSKVNGTYLFLIGAESFSPLLIYENGHLQAWGGGGLQPGRFSNEFIEAQLMLVPEQWPGYIRRLVFQENFFVRDKRYTLIKDGAVAGEARTTRITGTGEGDGMIWIEADLANTQGTPLETYTGEDLIATNAPAKYFAGGNKQDRKTTLGEDDILLKHAQKILDQQKIPKNSIHRYDSRAIFLNQSSTPLLVASYGTTLAGATVQDKTGTQPEFQMFMVMMPDRNGAYQVAYETHNRKIEDEPLTSIKLIAHADLNLDGKEELVIRTTSYGFYAILMQKGEKFVKLLNASAGVVD